MEMTKHRFLLLVIILISAVFMSGCTAILKVNVSDIKIEKVSPKGLRSIDVGMSAMIENPGAKMSISNIAALISYEGKDIGTITAEPIELARKFSGRFPVNVNMTVADAASVWDVVKIVSSKEKSDACIVDLTFIYKQGSGAPMTIRRKGLKVGDLTKSTVK